MSTGAPDDYRLPINVKPTHYSITICTDLEKLTFAGFVRVSLDIVTETSKIILNAAELDIGKASLFSESLNENVSLSDAKVSQERLVYELSRALPARSRAKLTIHFGSSLKGGIGGYYRSSWVQDGKTKYYALTQFQPTSARRAFPCWDEPLLKATFAIKLISRAGTTSLSNMPAISERTLGGGDLSGTVDPDISALIPLSEPSGHWNIADFQTTPPMSSYVVAYANGEFEFLEKTVVMPLSRKTLPLRIYATADLIHQAQFALDIKASVLPLYETMFDIEYPLPKLDTLVASNLEGAMENWGLITGQPSALLFDSEKADLRAKKLVARSQSHEVAHMWFGNITTMEWWNYLYLNEGFATMVGEVVAIDWKVDSEFISVDLNMALNLDAKLSSHPIEVDCPDANNVTQIFDSLSYSKAASVLRMLSDYVGEDRFLAGVSIYLKKHLYANSVTRDLWDGIHSVTSIDVSYLMENWVSKIGFPVVTVTENENGITVRQDRFLEMGSANPEDNMTIWNIPLNIISLMKDTPQLLKGIVLEERQKDILLDTSKPFKLNAATKGVFRVLYTPERLQKIVIESAKHGSLFSLSDRIGLVQDSLALSKAGLLKLSAALTLIDILKQEEEYLVWSSISANLDDLTSIWWEDRKVLEKLHAFTRVLFVPLVEKLGYVYEMFESTDTTLLRTLAITQAAKAGDARVIKELTDRFETFITSNGNNAQIPPELQQVIFSTSVKYGGLKEYNAVVSFHDNSANPTTRRAAIFAMTATKDAKLINRTFEFALTKARNQDVSYFFAGLTGNHTTRRQLAQFFYDNFDQLYNRFKVNFTLQHLVSFAYKYLSTEQDLNNIKEFFKGKDISKFSSSLAQSMDNIRARIAFLSRSTEDLNEWLGI